jgi:hypothetical protein
MKMNKRKQKKQEDRVINVLVVLLAAVVLYRACSEFYSIAWGTGKWWGEFSFTWAILYYFFVAFCVFLFVFAVLFIWNNKLFTPAVNRIVAIRESLGTFRWLLWFIVLVMPVWFFQYTLWGFVFQKLYIRIFIWIINVCLLTVISSSYKQLAGWNEFLSSLVLTVSSFSIVASLKNVNNYPFSLGWSEGNRLWDYSVMFGRDLYIYPEDRKIPVLLDFGRQFVGGVPFIFPGISITVARLWVGLTLIIPYLLLGIATFRKIARNKTLWLILTLWSFLFLKQGPIHPPLVLSAALVALAWQAPLWYAIPLVMGAGYFAETSRFTWIFAPGIWIFVLEFSSISFASFKDRKTVPLMWRRALILGVLGIFGGLLLPNLLDSAGMLISYPVSTTATPVATAIAQVPVSVIATPVPVTTVAAHAPTFFDRVINVITIQPLLWYRLLPNSTYDNGILFSLLLAITPLVIILLYLSKKGLWALSKLQKLALVLPLLAFLVVGLVASTKIGGGGDLHNMDMFLIGLFFIGILAWQNGGGDWIQNGKSIPPLMKIVIIVFLVNSSLGSLFEMRSFSLGEDAALLKKLSDAPNETDLEMLPTRPEIVSALQIIQKEVDQARSQGEVLFIDQRQLLTFGAITDVPLVPEYEKKVLMNQALSEDAAYFDRFYADLAVQRFSLIITEPLHTPTQDSSYQFGEENNAWVKWVSSPVLCYYEPLVTIKTVRVQLLVPNKNAVDCSSALP